MWEMAQICGELSLVFDKRLEYVGSDLEIWEMAKIFRKWLRYMLEMPYEFDKRLIYV